MLLYQISDIDYTPKYTYLKLRISTIRGRLTDGAHRTVFSSDKLDLRSDTVPRIQVKELLLDDAYLTKVVEEKKSWFTRMEVLDLIYHQYLFTANSLGCQPTASQYLQRLTPQTIALATAATDFCAVWICGWKEGHSNVFSRWILRYVLPIPSDQCYSGSHCTHQSHIHGPLDSTLQCNSARIGAPQFPPELLAIDWQSSILFHTRFPLVRAPQFQPAHLGVDWRSYIEFRTPYPTHTHIHTHRHTHTHTSTLFGAPTLVWALLNPRRCSSA